MKIVLLGYMASGKTSIGKKLARTIGLDFIDLDAYISENEDASMAEIFKNKGEIYFRKIESQHLEELLNKKQDFVLALGGGTPCYAQNLKIINKEAVSVYLKASLKTLHNKLSKDKNKKKRPLIAHLDNTLLLEFIAKHLFERNAFYDRATYTINIDQKTKKEITKELAQLLNRDRP